MRSRRSLKVSHTQTSVPCGTLNEVHPSLACGEPTALVLLDLSAIGHNILLGYLKSWFDLGGTVLKWFASYLSDRCQTIKIGSALSELSKIINGVPQGSVLGPLLFSLYTTPLSKIIRLHPHIKFHFYVDDTQLYKSHQRVACTKFPCSTPPKQYLSISGNKESGCYLRLRQLLSQSCCRACYYHIRDLRQIRKFSYF